MTAPYNNRNNLFINTLVLTLACSVTHPPARLLTFLLDHIIKKTHHARIARIIRIHIKSHTTHRKSSEIHEHTKMKPSSCWFLWFMVRFQYSISNTLRLCTRPKAFAHFYFGILFSFCVELRFVCARAREKKHVKYARWLLCKSKYLTRNFILFEKSCVCNGKNGASTCFAQSRIIRDKMMMYASQKRYSKHTSLHSHTAEQRRAVRERLNTHARAYES